MGQFLRDRRIVGRSSDGLQFVVIALVVDVRRRSTEAVLMISAIVSAPWASLAKPAVALALVGAAGAAAS